MTDAETAAPDPDAFAAAVPPPPAGGQVPAVPPPPAGGQIPAGPAPRRRRGWLVAGVTAVVVAGLAAGLLVWAPWIPPPVLRPAGLKGGPITAASVTLRWSGPPTGPLPDKYLIKSNGVLAATVSGKSTSYRQGGLDPATTYQYRVIAVRGGKRSPASALLTVSTVTPPVSQARLQGAWNIHASNTHVTNFTFSHGSGSLYWRFSPACATGACDLTVRGQMGKHSFTTKLTRTGAVYRGQTVDNTVPCGPAGSTIPDPVVLKIRIHVTGAAPDNQVWAAATWAGTISGTSRYISTASFYCDAGSFTTTLSGAPA